MIPQHLLERMARNMWPTDLEKQQKWIEKHKNESFEIGNKEWEDPEEADNQEEGSKDSSKNSSKMNLFRKAMDWMNYEIELGGYGCAAYIVAFFCVAYILKQIIVFFAK